MGVSPSKKKHKNDCLIIWLLQRILRFQSDNVNLNWINCLHSFKSVIVGTKSIHKSAVFLVYRIVLVQVWDNAIFKSGGFFIYMIAFSHTSDVTVFKSIRLHVFQILMLLVKSCNWHSNAPLYACLVVLGDNIVMLKHLVKCEKNILPSNPVSCVQMIERKKNGQFSNQISLESLL